MLEELPGYNLASLPLGYRDRDVQSVFYLAPQIFPAGQDFESLFLIKIEQLAKVSEHRYYTAERLNSHVSLVDSAVDWFSKCGEKFELRNQLSGLEAGLILHTSLGGVFVINHYDGIYFVEELRKCRDTERESALRKRWTPEAQLNVFCILDRDFKSLHREVVDTVSVA